MRIVFEEDMDDDEFRGQDYLEVILTEREYLDLKDFALVREFPLGFYEVRGINVCVRVDKLNEAPKLINNQVEL